jgi:hypothetical protein
MSGTNYNRMSPSTGIGCFSGCELQRKEELIALANAMPLPSDLRRFGFSRHEKAFHS